MEKESGRPVLALVADLYFITRVQSVCDQLGHSVKFIESVEQVGHESADFIRYVSDSKPVLIILDLNHHAIPWAEWIAAVKTAPETQEFPVISFGSHKDVDTMKQARQIGADAVFAKSRFTEAMPEIIKKHIL